MISPFSVSRLGVGLGPSYLSAIGFKDMSTQDGRSGYWRLFYYQLQEAELEKEKKKREQEQGQKAPEGKSEAAVEAATTVPKKPKPAKRKPRVAKPVVEELPKVHPRPIYNKVPEQVTIEPWLHVVSSQFRAEYLVSATLQRIMVLQKAANDEEEEIITLLLLAA